MSDILFKKEKTLLVITHYSLEKLKLGGKQ